MNIKYYVIYDNEYNVVKITTEVDKNDNFFCCCWKNKYGYKTNIIKCLKNNFTDLISFYFI